MEVLPSPTWFSWVGSAEFEVKILFLLLAGGLVGLMVWRAPIVASAIAIARGKGETERERQQADEISRLEKLVGGLEARIQLMEHRWEERIRFDAQRRHTLQIIVERAQCMTPDCRFAELVDALRTLASDEAWAVDGPAHGTGGHD